MIKMKLTAGGAHQPATIIKPTSNKIAGVAHTLGVFELLATGGLLVEVAGAGGMGVSI